MGSWIQRLLLQIMMAATPHIAEALRDFAKEYRAKAAETSNPWDDRLADMICFLFGVE